LIDNGKPIVESFYKEAKSLGNKPQNVFIGGFSQGCIMAQATFLMIKDQNPGGIIGFSGIEALDPSLIAPIDFNLKK
jgi:predicted esterase